MAQLLTRDGLDNLIRILRERAYTVVGPMLVDDAIVLGELTSGADLPEGWGVSVGPGDYRVHRRGDRAVFNHSAGPQSWKQFLHPPRRPLWSSDGATFTAIDAPTPRYAFLGVRACDLAGLQVLTGVLADGAYPDTEFCRRRSELFVVAVGCVEPGGLCFCASLGTGPQPGPGYDLCLTEQVAHGASSFVVDIGSELGAAVLEAVPARVAADAEIRAARAAVNGAAEHMGRRLPDADLHELFQLNRESPVWDEIAGRCLTCGNCTMVCPTCFCTTTEDHTSLSAGPVERTQRWASCFELDFSYLHGGSVRSTGAQRYRQWITHKFSSWHDQFGAAGCVGCGRCIAWCPVGIDVTAEAARLAEQQEPAR